MQNIRFEIYSETVEKTLDTVYYSNTLVFRLKRMEGDFVTFDQDVTLIDIEQGKTDLPMTEYENIKQAYYYYIDDHNERLASHNNNIRFEITDMDSRCACQYKEYLNDKLIKEGKGWAKDLKNDAELKAWDKAVIEYKNKHGIETPETKIKKLINECKEAISKLDSELPEQIDLTPPLVELAIPKITEDPCGFINDVIHAAQVSITRINGFPSPVELANYYIKLAKGNICSMIKHTANSQSAMVNAIVEEPFELVTESFASSPEYYANLGAEMEEFYKLHSDEFGTFSYLVTDEPIIKDAINSSGTVHVYGGTKKEVLSTLGFTGTDSKEYCKTKMKWGVVVRTLRGNRKITVHKDLVEEVKSIFDDIYNAGFDVKYLGGYFYRPINNPRHPNSSDLSMHSFGCAIDINPEQNPFTKTQDRPFEYPPSYWNSIKYDPNTCIWTNDHPVVKIFKKYEWGWGGRYGDFMHFSKTNGS